MSRCLANAAKSDGEGESDITIPPHTKQLSLFNVYVALSRSSGRESIRILRDFDDKTVGQGQHLMLLEEMARLEELDRKTTAAYERAVRWKTWRVTS